MWRGYNKSSRKYYISVIRWFEINSECLQPICLKIFFSTSSRLQRNENNKFNKQFSILWCFSLLTLVYCAFFLHLSFEALCTHSFLTRERYELPCVHVYVYPYVCLDNSASYILSTENVSWFYRMVSRNVARQWQNDRSMARSCWWVNSHILEKITWKHPDNFPVSSHLPTHVASLEFLSMTPEPLECTGCLKNWSV
jgi:hypothetical protein